MVGWLNSGGREGGDTKPRLCIFVLLTLCLTNYTRERSRSRRSSSANVSQDAVPPRPTAAGTATICLCVMHDKLTSGGPPSSITGFPTWFELGRSGSRHPGEKSGPRTPDLTGRDYHHSHRPQPGARRPLLARRGFRPPSAFPALAVRAR